MRRIIKVKNTKKIIIVFFILLLLLILFLSILPSKTPPPSPIWQTILGRDEGNPSDRTIVYQARIPTHWIRKDPLETDSIQDTTKALCEFYIEQGLKSIRITVHNFPILNEKTRIPAQAQIQRWKQQFSELDPTLTRITASSHGGFFGLFLEAQGILEGKSIKLLGWSMQLASTYVRQLSLVSTPLEQQKRSDYTIKVVGSPELINQHARDIKQFADSFALKDELPWSP